MTSQNSSGLQVNRLNRRTDSILADTASHTDPEYSETRPEKRPRISDPSAPTGPAAGPVTKDISVIRSSSSSSSTSGGNRQVRELVAASTATSTSENGSLFSSRMYMFRRGRGHALRFHSSADPAADADTLRNASWAYEEETNSSGPEDEEIYYNRQSRLKTELDWTWDEASKSKACTVTNDNTEVRFHLDYSCGTAAARGSLPMTHGQHYWEIKMASAVYGTDMMIGLGTKQINMAKFSHIFCSMLGKDSNSESCGLSYTGRFHSAGNSCMYCSKYGQGTVIGVHLDMWFGTITFFKNGKCLGIAGKGLLGKAWHPMVSSTAARSSMRLAKARSFPSSLQFWCCTSLRKAIPPDLSVLDVLEFPPGLRAFLSDNLSWLLEAHHSRTAVTCKSKGTQTLLSTIAIPPSRKVRTQES